MDYRYLKAFIVTAKWKSFTLAAKELRVSQSAISRQIKLLEQELKEDLFLRSSKKVQLTPKGKDFLKSCESFEGQINDIFQEGKRQTLRVGILQGILESWFHSIVGKYYSSSKGKHNLDIKVGGVSELKKMLEENLLDLAFLTENIQTETHSSLVLFQEKFFLIGPKGTDPRQPEKYPWIVYSHEDNLFSISKKRPEKIICVNSLSTIIELVKKGLGIAVVPEHSLRGEGMGNCGQWPIKIREKSFLYLVGPNYRSPSSPAKEMIEIIRSSL